LKYRLNVAVHCSVDRYCLRMNLGEENITNSKKRCSAEEDLIA